MSEDMIEELWMNIREGRTDSIAKLLETGEAVNALYRRSSLLHYAAKYNDCEATKLLCGAGAVLDAKDRYSYTPLVIAAKNGHHDVVTVLLESGASVDMMTCLCRTPFLWAVSEGHIDCMRTLVDRGAKVDVYDRYKTNCLDFAVKGGHASMLRILLDMLTEQQGEEKVVTMLTKDKLGDTTPLHVAAQDDRPECLQILLASGLLDPCSVTWLKSRKYNALMLAVEKGNVQCAQLLLSHVDDDNKSVMLNQTSVQGMTAVHLAAQAGLVDCLDLLLSHGNTTGARDSSGKTPLHLAAKHGWDSALLHLVNANPSADIVNAITEKGRSALHYAAQNNHTCCCQVLLDAGASPDPWYKTPSPLHLATETGNAESVQMLLRHGAHVNGVTQHRQTALHRAVRKGHVQCAALLLGAGASVDPEDESETTPAMIAVAKSKPEILEHLINANCQLSKVRIPPLRSATSEADASGLSHKIQICKMIAYAGHKIAIDLFVKSLIADGHLSDSLSPSLEREITAIVKSTKQVSTLECLCVWKLRHVLGYNARTKVLSLPLPVCLMDAILLKGLDKIWDVV